MTLDQRKVRLYRFLLQIERITLEQVPEPYRMEIAPEEEE